MVIIDSGSEERKPNSRYLHHMGHLLNAFNTTKLEDNVYLFFRHPIHSIHLSGLSLHSPIAFPQYPPPTPSPPPPSQQQAPSPSDPPPTHLHRLLPPPEPSPRLLPPDTRLKLGAARHIDILQFVKTRPHTDGEAGGDGGA